MQPPRSAVLCCALFLLGVLPLSTAHGQRAPRMWVFFTDKSEAVKGDDAQTKHLTSRARARRSKVLPSDRLIDETDLPVNPSYVRAVAALGAKVHSVSRWLNAVSVEERPGLEVALKKLPIVSSVRSVRSGRRSPEVIHATPLASLAKSSSVIDSAAYGQSLTQNTTANTVPLHALGVIGKGVLVGMLDDGFNNHRVHPGLRSIDVIAEYDFMQRDSDVSVAPGEFASQGYHGAATLSVLAGYEYGALIGGAFGASLALGKTEIDSVEIIAEEDNYVEGLEWLEGLGVDVISTSIGYVDWYSYQDLDGQTAITTRVARMLASRGVLLVTAMGNEGHFRSGTSETGTLIAPADADSILSVGAVSASRVLASFSSTGPTFDGRTKPEVVTQGQTMRVASGTTPSGYYNSQGTSFSTPLTASVAALVLSAHPEATPMQVRSAIMSTAVPEDDGTARTISYPNNFYGWGLVDAYAAALSLGPVVSNEPIVRYDLVAEQPSLLVYVRVASHQIVDPARFVLYAKRETESIYVSYPFEPGAENGLYLARVPVTDAGDTSFVGYLVIAAQGGPDLRRPAGVRVFKLHPTTDSIAGLFPPIPNDTPTEYVLEQNYPNPFNAGTVVVFRAPVAGFVEVSVYSLLGQKVRTLFAGDLSAGTHTIVWSHGDDDSGRPLATGMYLLRLVSQRGIQTRKIVLAK